MFLFCNDIDFASYVDDNAPYCIGKTPEEVISQLEFGWFEIWMVWKITDWKGIPISVTCSKPKMTILRQILIKTEFLIQDLKNFWQSIKL